MVLEEEWERDDRVEVSSTLAPTGEFIAKVLVSPSESVLYLERAIAKKAALPLRPRLYLDGALLKESDALVTAGIGEGSQVSAELGPAVVTASADRTAKVWRAETGECEQTFVGHEEQVNHASFSSDCKYVVTASEDKTARVWHAATGECLAVLHGHTDSVHHAAFAPDGRHIVTASADHTVGIWESRHGTRKWTLKNPSSSELDKWFNPDSVQVWFTPDSQHVMTTGRDGTTKSWSVKSGRFERAWQGNEPTYCASFSPDGALLVTAPGDLTARVTHVEDQDCERVLEGHTDIVMHANFAPPRVQLPSRPHTSSQLRAGASSPSRIASSPSRWGESSPARAASPTRGARSP